MSIGDHHGFDDVVALVGIELGDVVEWVPHPHEGKERNRNRHPGGDAERSAERFGRRRGGGVASRFWGYAAFVPRLFFCRVCSYRSHVLMITEEARENTPVRQANPTIAIVRSAPV